MKNTDLDSKVVTGVLIGGIVGIGALAVFLALRKKETSLEHIGKMLHNVDEILENHHIEEPSSVKSLGKKIHAHEDTVSTIVDWVATGISIWKKFKN